jgi:hypothetical protein
MNMSEVCKLLRLSAAFLICVAIAQLISYLPKSIYIIGASCVISYLVGKSGDALLFQVIAAGLAVGWIRCSLG